MNLAINPAAGPYAIRVCLVGRKGLEPLTPCASCTSGGFTPVRRSPETLANTRLPFSGVQRRSPEFNKFGCHFGCQCGVSGASQGGYDLKLWIGHLFEDAAYLPR